MLHSGANVHQILEAVASAIAQYVAAKTAVVEASKHTTTKYYNEPIGGVLRPVPVGTNTTYERSDTTPTPLPCAERGPIWQRSSDIEEAQEQQKLFLYLDFVFFFPLLPQPSQNGTVCKT